VGGGPGDFDLESAMREQPFEHIETYRGYRSFREMSHIGAEDVAVNFLIRQLRDEAKDVWEAVYSNRFDSRNLVYRIFHFERNDFEYPDFETEGVVRFFFSKPFSEKKEVSEKLRKF
jgi:hypothetical protein